MLVNWPDIDNTLTAKNEFFSQIVHINSQDQIIITGIQLCFTKPAQCRVYIALAFTQHINTEWMDNHSSWLFHLILCLFQLTFCMLDLATHCEFQYEYYDHILGQNAVPDLNNGWDTDQFPTAVDELSLVMYEILKSGGFTTVGLNFDCKLRRQSSDPTDLFHGNIGGMDHMALALKKAAAILKNDFIADKLSQRYEGWGQHFGQSISNGQQNLESLLSHSVSNSLQPKHVSGQLKK